MVPNNPYKRLRM